MTLCQTLTIDFEHEMTNTRRLLERIPLDDAHREYKPHQKSMPMDRLSTHVAEIPGWPKAVLECERMVLPADFKPRVAASTQELLAIFDRSVEDGRAALAAATDAEMQKNWTFVFGDQVVLTEVRTQVIRGLLNHLVHHRAQLGVYLRLNGIPVPGMYGPSADEM